jgi:hypothetical protein
MPLLDSARPARSTAPANVMLNADTPLLTFHAFIRRLGDPIPVKTIPFASTTGGLLNQPLPALRYVVTRAPVATDRP